MTDQAETNPGAGTPILPRLKILEIFHDSDRRRLTAHDVHQQLLADELHVRLVTVRRVLNQFEDAGLLSRDDPDNGNAAYKLEGLRDDQPDSEIDASRRVSSDASEFLQDIGVVLGSDYADPSRPFFGPFLPYYGRLRDLSPSERLTAAYDLLEPSARMRVNALVRESLERCASVPLGIWRSLVVIDVFHHTSREIWTPRIWNDLLTRPRTPGEKQIWIDQLLRRWEAWKLKVNVPKERWIEAVGIVPPIVFRRLMRYLQMEISGDDDKAWMAILGAALKRLRSQIDDFVAAGLDAAAIEQELASYHPGRALDLRAQPNASIDTSSAESRALTANLQKAGIITAEQFRDAAGEDWN